MAMYCSFGLMGTATIARRPTARRLTCRVVGRGVSAGVCRSQGLTDLNGAPDGVLNNVSFIFDGTRHMFFAVRHGHPDPIDMPNYLSQTVQIAALDEASVWNGGGTWQVLGNLSTASAGYNGQATGWARNDNPGLLRTPYGTLYAYNRLEIFYSASQSIAQCGAPFPCDLWTYTIASEVATSGEQSPRRFRPPRDRPIGTSPLRYV